MGAIDRLRDIMRKQWQTGREMEGCEIDTENFPEPVIFCNLAPCDDDEMRRIEGEIKEFADSENLDFEVTWGRGEYVIFKERK